MKYSDEECLAALKACAEDIGKSPSQPEYNRWRSETDSDVPTGRTFQNRFGGWNQIKTEVGLETVLPSDQRPPHRQIRDDGYIQIMHHDGNSLKYVYEHRLLATLLVEDISELKGKHTHHEIPIPWLNYQDNLQVVTPAEHRKIHSKNPEGGADDKPTPTDTVALPDESISVGAD